jgi:hypothetical protein
VRPPGSRRGTGRGSRAGCQVAGQVTAATSLNRDEARDTKQPARPTRPRPTRRREQGGWSDRRRSGTPRRRRRQRGPRVGGADPDGRVRDRVARGWPLFAPRGGRLESMARRANPKTSLAMGADPQGSLERGLPNSAAPQRLVVAQEPGERVERRAGGHVVTRDGPARVQAPARRSNPGCKTTGRRNPR